MQLVNEVRPTHLILVGRYANRSSLNAAKTDTNVIEIRHLSRGSRIEIVRQ